MAQVDASKLLDGVVISLFVVLLSGIGLLAFVNSIHLAMESGPAVVANIIPRVFPFKGKHMEVNLTHILLFALLIAILSLRDRVKKEKKD